MWSIDGFNERDHDAFVAYSAPTADRFYRAVHRAGARVGVTVAGIENLPKGRALIVANHAFGWDVMLPMAAVWVETRRPIWALGEHLWWKIPFLRRLAAAVGTVDGTPENVDRLLEREELVMVLPGGLREAVKPRELRYRLLWGHRYGFIRAAIRNQAPIVPLAALGADEFFDFVGDAYRRGERWLGRPGFPIPLPTRLLPIPHLASLRYVFGEPIAPPARDLADDKTAQRKLRHEVEGALHELIEIELAKRAGVRVE
ncbi:MAG: lysophospholipid acyltransferase family protein [Polyangiaceae bacterium]